MYLHCSTIDELSIKKFHVTVIKFLLYPTLSKLGEVGLSRLNIKWNRGVSLFTSTYMSCYAVFHLRFMHAVTLTKYQTSLGYHTVTFIFIFFFHSKLMISISDTCTHTLLKSHVFANTPKREPMIVMHVTTKHIHERITLLTKRYTVCFMIYYNLVYAIYILEVHHPHDVSCRLV